MTQTPVQESSVADLGTAILANMAGAPPADLGRLLDPKPEIPSTVQRFVSGVGMSGVHIPLVQPAEPEPPAENGDTPELFCPGPVRDNPALGEEVNEGVVAWADEVGIYPGQLDHLRSCNFGRLIMLTHPATDDADRLLAATKCVVAEWAADDYYIDEADLGADPAVASSRLATLNAVIDPAGLPARYQTQLDEYRENEPIANAFRSAMGHLAQYMTPTQLARFQHQMSSMFTAWNHAVEWRANDRMPPAWEYLVQRNVDSYLPPMILIDVLAGYELPATQYFMPPVRRAFTMAAQAAVLINDLHSAGKESEDDVNLPRVISIEEGCSMEEAVRQTVEIHNELMHTFVAEATVLSATDPLLRRFFTDVWGWLGGSREWHATTKRYNSEPA